MEVFNKFGLISTAVTLIASVVWIFLDLKNPEAYKSLIAPISFYIFFIITRKPKLPQDTGIEDLDDIHTQLNSMKSIKEETLKIEFQSLFENHSFYRISENSIYNSLFIYHRSQILLERYKKFFSKECKQHITNAISCIVELNSIIGEFYQVYGPSFQIELILEKKHSSVTRLKKKLPTSKPKIDSSFSDRCNDSLSKLLCTLIKAQLCTRQESDFCKNEENGNPQIAELEDLDNIVNVYELEDFRDSKMNHGEKLLKAYFNLPITERFELAKKLNLLEKDESIESPNKDEISSQFLLRAKSKNLLSDLWDLLFKNESEPNPFE